VFLERKVKYTSTTHLLLHLAQSWALQGLAIHDGLRNMARTDLIVSLLRHGDLHSTKELLVKLSGLAASGQLFGLGLKAEVQQDGARLLLDFLDAFTTLVTHGDKLYLVIVKNLQEEILVLFIEGLETNQVDLGHHDQEGLVLEQRLDAVEEANLLTDGLSAGFRNIDKEENAGTQVGQSSDGLHFDSVAFFQRVVQYTGGVDHLPSDVIMVHMSDKEGLGCERVRLDIHICVSDIVHEAGLTNIGTTGDHERSFIGINTRKTGHVLSDFFQVDERGFELLSHGGHTTECCFL
jgi:hypothetical protein